MTAPNEPQWTDAAKRCSDAIRLHIAAGMARKWAAIRLSDGTSDGVAYDYRDEAVSHQLHETQCAYVQIPVDDMPPQHAEVFLAFHRKVYDQGFRMSSDVKDKRQVIMPYTVESMRNAFARASLRGKNVRLP